MLFALLLSCFCRLHDSPYFSQCCERPWLSQGERSNGERKFTPSLREGVLPGCILYAREHLCEGGTTMKLVEQLRWVLHFYGQWQKHRNREALCMAIGTCRDIIAMLEREQDDVD